MLNWVNCSVVFLVRKYLLDSVLQYAMILLWGVKLEQCAHWILESHHPTLVGPDCLSVVKAADLIRRGKHSSNPRLQSLLASVNRRNIRFFHNSGKAGLHRVPDHLSRMTDRTCNSKDCAIERFLDKITVNV